MLCSVMVVSYNLTVGKYTYMYILGHGNVLILYTCTVQYLHYASTMYMYTWLVCRRVERMHSASEGLSVWLPCTYRCSGSVGMLSLQ